MVEERQAISVCPLKLVLWLFSVRSLSRDSRGIWLWKASALSQSEAESKHPAFESLCISQTTPNITCDIQTLLYAEAVTREQDRTTWRYKRQSAAKEKKKKAFLFLRTA